jgi:N-acetylglutamate synthase-like GNAT family acetyltransferase
MTATSTTPIREAQPADLPRLLELLAQLEEDRQPRGEATDAELRALDDVTSDARQRLFVIEHAGQIAGTATLIVVPNLTHDGRPYAIVENVVIDAPARGGHLGERLMAHLVEEARRAGCYKVALTSAKRRTDAHRFYTRIGFRAAHEGFRIDL